MQFALHEHLDILGDFDFRRKSNQCSRKVFDSGVRFWGDRTLELASVKLISEHTKAGTPKWAFPLGPSRLLLQLIIVRVGVAFMDIRFDTVHGRFDFFRGTFDGIVRHFRLRVVRLRAGAICGLVDLFFNLADCVTNFFTECLIAHDVLLSVVAQVKTCGVHVKP
jgi:hypothetical protein